MFFNSAYAGCFSSLSIHQPQVFCQKNKNKKTHLSLKSIKITLNKKQLGFEYANKW